MNAIAPALGILILLAVGFLSYKILGNDNVIEQSVESVLSKYYEMNIDISPEEKVIPQKDVK
jgi:hypothetical protein